MKNKTCRGLLLSFLITGLTVTPCYAAATQNKISDAKSQKQETQSSLNEAQSRIRSLEAKKDNLEAYLTELDGQLSDLSENLSDLQTKADAKQSELQELEKELEEAKARQSEQYESMKLRIQYMYEKSNDSYITMLLESKNFTDFLNTAENIMQITKYDRKMLENYKTTQEEIQAKEASVKEEQQAIEALQQESLDKQTEISEIMKSTNGQIETYQAQILSEEGTAKSLLEKISAQEAEIDKLIKQQKDEEAAAALAQRQAEEQAKKAALAAQSQQNSTPSKPAENTQNSTSSNTGTPSAEPEEEAVEETKPSEDTNTNNSSQGTYLGSFRITGYCNCSKCGGQGNTASGTVPAAGRTVAMGGVPFGTRLLINGCVYVVEDRGTPYGHVDIYYNTHEEALANGSYYTDVYQLN